MKCPYCGIGFHTENAEFEESNTYDEPETGRGFSISYGSCPDCENFIVYVEKGVLMQNSLSNPALDIIFPKYANRRVEPEVPIEYREDFIEAAAVLPISPKASAALSRRILQHTLREKFGLKRPSLAQEIDDFLKLKDVPAYLSGAVDAVRNIGNFAAHPLKDSSTGTIVAVEPGEAEWLLEVLESLFDFAFVQPERLAAKQIALNKKLIAMGKPPMKQ